MPYRKSADCIIDIAAWLEPTPQVSTGAPNGKSAGLHVESRGFLTTVGHEIKSVTAAPLATVLN